MELLGMTHENLGYRRFDYNDLKESPIVHVGKMIISRCRQYQYPLSSSKFMHITQDGYIYKGTGNCKEPLVAALRTRPPVVVFASYIVFLFSSREIDIHHKINENVKTCSVIAISRYNSIYVSELLTGSSVKLAFRFDRKVKTTFLFSPRRIFPPFPKLFRTCCSGRSFT